MYTTRTTINCSTAASTNHRHGQTTLNETSLIRQKPTYRKTPSSYFYVLSTSLCVRVCVCVWSCLLHDDGCVIVVCSSEVRCARGLLCSHMADQPLRHDSSLTKRRPCGFYKVHSWSEGLITTLFCLYVTQIY